MIFASAINGEQKPSIKKNSVLVLNFKNPILDSYTEAESSIFDLGDTKNVLLTDVLNAIQKAKTDENIKGISIEVDELQAGTTQADNIRDAIEDFKKSGKFVYAYGNNMSQKSYYLATIADKVFLNPVGMIELKGMSTEVTFFKDFADKYGVGIDIIRHGKFKAAVEPFMRNEISPENKEQLSTLLNDIWGNISNKIKTARKLDENSFKTAVDSLYGYIPEQAIKSKLADQLVQKSEYYNFIKKNLKIDTDKDFNQISIGKYINTLDNKNNDNNEIAVLYASGEIFNGDEYSNIHSDKYVKYIKDLADDDNVKAVVLRVNSPGGSGNASDEILFELQQLKKKKPLIVSFGDYAASGGYYISMAADKIYSEPNTLTGSIGVFGMITNFKELANRNGIRSDIVSTNANSQFYSPISGAAPGTIPMLTKSVESTYKRFVYFVTQNRKKSFEQIDAIGGGRVWSGTRAKELGLVDELGSIQQAINFAASKAKLKDFNVQNYPAKMSKFEEFFKNTQEEEIAAKVISKKIGKENYTIFEKVTNPKFNNGVQMSLPYKITIK
ncbi:signal peptide peptidase SppA [Cloacibacterium rupense]|uniref:Signal peptide peptidase SppA n=2 Tax=Cloacibacterium rupense TaxID=517423 RepID=A0ABQ2NM71_9FLAO|nr:signal peptide peptidase SppA [Cloacibacterium rupense]